MGGVHVSIHDVAPPFRAEVELALDMARDAGVRPALLVVPDFHGQAPIGADASFCAWLQGLQTDGHEILLHGHFHEKREKERGLGGFFAQHVVSNGEAEMNDLAEDAASQRLDSGERALTEAGLRIDGFVPPAWSMPRWLVPILAARGYTYSEDHLHVYAPNEGRKRASLVLNYASRSRARLYASMAFCRLATPLAALAPARIAIHPADMGVGRLRNEVRLLLAWGSGRFVRRGRELLA